MIPPVLTPDNMPALIAAVAGTAGVVVGGLFTLLGSAAGRRQALNLAQQQHAHDEQLAQHRIDHERREGDRARSWERMIAAYTELSILIDETDHDVRNVFLESGKLTRERLGVQYLVPVDKQKLATPENFLEGIFGMRAKIRFAGTPDVEKAYGAWASEVVKLFLDLEHLVNVLELEGEDLTTLADRVRGHCQKVLDLADKVIRRATNEVRPPSTAPLTPSLGRPSVGDP